MRTLQRFATVCFLGVTAVALFSLSACGSTDAPAPTGGAGATGSAGATGNAGAAGAALVGDATRGAGLYKSMNLQCNSCHGEIAEGSMGPNITGSMTAGIGSWTQAQFHDAVRSSKNKSGAALCFFMVSFMEKDVSEQGIADLYAFAKSKPAVETVNAGSYCTGASCACTGR